MAAPHGRIDASAASYAAACELCPTFRGAPQATRTAALADLDAHRRVYHRAQARDAAKKARRRARGMA